ncbi:coenzyme Q biosynthesis protein Coq4 [Helicosporidium sp. ATCC 50920]|nr:coenzyme Q biosynthesis protein Coq4 [Helicosporidium sp. ATCC 50920]|eukprot:KDD73373.1 coenzyme Q biosynthesis protein Coq4 [Helicosporidium sp. ATCC 50920]
MGDRGFRADERPPVRFVGDPEMAWVMARSREVHDFWHVLFDCHTNVFGETALKALECVQTGLPMTFAAVAGGSWRMRAQDRSVFRSMYLPWALRAGARAADLLCVYYEECLDVSGFGGGRTGVQDGRVCRVFFIVVLFLAQDDLEAMRRRYRILVAPSSAQNDWKRRPKAA